MFDIKIPLHGFVFIKCIDKKINIIGSMVKILNHTIIVLLSSMLFLFTGYFVFAQQYGTYQSENFEISNLSAIYKGKYIEDKYQILGIVKNIGNDTSSEIILIGTIFDKNNNLIGVYRTIPILDISKHGNDSPFRFDIFTNKSLFDHFNIEIGGK